MLKAIKFRLYPTNLQKVELGQTFGCVRWVYNKCIEVKSKAWEVEKKNISRYELSSVLTKWKKEELTLWLKEVNSQSLQQAIANLDSAYSKFFKKTGGFPKFKSKFGKQSFSVPAQCFLLEDAIKIPKIGVIKAEVHRQVTGEVRSMTISKTTTGKYFVSILLKTEDELPEKLPTTEAGTVGIDLGLTHFATLSTGDKIENPRYLRKRLRKIKVAQRRLSKSKKGSKNRDKKRWKVAVLHEKVTNCRNDFLHKLTSRLVNDNQVDSFAIEDLAVSNMVKNHCLALSISDVGWSEFRRQLTYKAERLGKNVLVIGRFEPSSKTCSCGLKKTDLKLRDRVWTCSCGLTHDRDLLAASNIKKWALHPQHKLLGLE